jgi:hypothetical protein
MSSMQRRGPVILVAAAIGALFVAGLFIHGVVGAVLLLLTDVVLVTISAALWSRIRPQGRPLRVGIIVIIAAIAVAKLVAG